MGQELIKDIGFSANALRLPYSEDLADAFGIDNVRWKVLTDAIFPGAASVDSIIMALTYCRARNLDVFKRPVHIVPMWSSVLKRMVDTVWPSIAELRTTAFRTGLYAGRDKTEFGPMMKGQVGKATVERPEWAQITVYRIVAGQRCAFPGPQVDWLESYARKGRDDDSPNEQWMKRPRGQIEKCAEAAALRCAFPEEIGNEYAAEEMEGQRIYEVQETPRRVAPPPPPAAQIEPPKPQPPLGGMTAAQHDLVTEAFAHAAKGRREFDPWYAGLTDQARAFLAPRMPELMMTAKAATQGAAPNPTSASAPAAEKTTAGQASTPAGTAAGASSATGAAPARRAPPPPKTIDADYAAEANRFPPRAEQARVEQAFTAEKAHVTDLLPPLVDPEALRKEFFDALFAARDEGSCDEAWADCIAPNEDALFPPDTQMFKDMLAHRKAALRKGR